MTTKISDFAACILFLAGTAAAASEGPNRKDDAVKWTFQAGAVHQFNSSLDSGGDMSASRWFVRGGVGRVFSGRWRVGASLGFGETK